MPLAPDVEELLDTLMGPTWRRGDVLGFQVHVDLATRTVSVAVGFGPFDPGDGELTFFNLDATEDATLKFIYLDGPESDDLFHFVAPFACS
jgi:hypothetical protein